MEIVGRLRSWTCLRRVIGIKAKFLGTRGAYACRGGGGNRQSLRCWHNLLFISRVVLSRAGAANALLRGGTWQSASAAAEADGADGEGRVRIRNSWKAGCNFC